MLSAEEKEYISEVVNVILKDLKKSHLLKDTSDAVYDEVSEMLKLYYKNKQKDARIKKGLEELKNDMYFDIIPLYYQEQYTIESIAEVMNVDVSTIVRNKKRLCLSLYILLE